jgi:hypothetical protein
MNMKGILAVAVILVAIFSVSILEAKDNPVTQKDNQLSNDFFNWDIMLSSNEHNVGFAYTPAETSGASYHCTPSDPVPADKAENVDYQNVTLSWDCTNGTKTGVKYNVYLGNDERMLPLVSDQQISELSITLDRLLPSTTYYWTVVAIYQNQTTRNPDRWTFTTKKGKLPPYIKLAGYGFTNITQASGGNLNIYALCEDQDLGGSVQTVKVFLGGVDTGVRLTDKNKDTIWELSVPGVPAGLQKGTEYVIELVAVDNEGNESDMWPYVTVHSELPKMQYSYNDAIPWLNNKIKTSDVSNVYDFTMRQCVAEKLMTKAVASSFPQNPLGKPAILAAGYWNTVLEAQKTIGFSMLNITALIWEASKPISRADVYKNMNSTTPYQDANDPPANIQLFDDGSQGGSQSGDETAGDRFWTYMGVAKENAGILKLGIVATDGDNKKSDMWPKLIIH